MWGSGLEVIDGDLGLSCLVCRSGSGKRLGKALGRAVRCRYVWLARATLAVATKAFASLRRPMNACLAHASRQTLACGHPQ